MKQNYTEYVSGDLHIIKGYINDDMSFFRRKNMKKYTYRKFLILLFMINLIAITAVYIKYCNARLPDTIHINKGETVSLCYDVPVSATIDHQTIRLNQPIVFKQCHMGQYEMKTNLFGAIPLKKIKVKVVDDQKITPSGEVIGVYVETDGLFVLDTDQFTGETAWNMHRVKINYIVEIISKRLMEKILYQKNNSSKKSIKVKENL